MFKKEFKRIFKDELMRDKQKFLNIKNLIKVLIKINDKLYKQVIKKRYN